MKKKKSAVLISVFVIASFLFGTLVAASPNGTPFQDLWDAIFGLQNNVDNLQSQIDQIELMPGPQGPQGIQGEPGLGLEPIGYLSIPASAFVPYCNTQEYQQGLTKVYPTSDNGGVFYAPVFLPNGVTVKYLWMFAKDNRAGDSQAVTCRLIDSTVYGSGGLWNHYTMAEVTSIDGTSTTLAQDDTISHSVIDNRFDTYYLQLVFPNSGGSTDALEFCYAIIQYEHPT
jgi:hypothetical protein